MPTPDTVRMALEPLLPVHKYMRFGVVELRDTFQDLEDAQEKARELSIEAGTPTGVAVVMFVVETVSTSYAVEEYLDQHKEA